MSSTHLEIVESIGRLVAALALGSAIGFERQWHQKVTGLRTNVLVALGNAQTVSTAGAKTGYFVTLKCKSVEEAHLRLLLLHALSQAGLVLRRIDSSEIPDTPNVAVTARVVAAKRNDAALEQIVGRLRLEAHVGAAAWQVERTTSAAGAACFDGGDCTLDPMALAADGPSRGASCRA